MATASQTHEEALQPILGQWIAEAAGQLSAAPGATLSLKSLKTLRDRLKIAFDAPVGPKEIFLVYVLHTFIHDVFDNLAGDMPYSIELDRGRQALFADLGKALQELAAGITTGYDPTIESCSRLVTTYLDGVHRLNDLQSAEEK